MTDKEKIKAEIERLKNELIQEAEKGYKSEFDEGRISAFEDMIIYINSLEEPEPISEELEKLVYRGEVYTRTYRDELDKFANRYTKSIPKPEKRFAKYSDVDMVLAVKEGARFNKQQMMKDAIDATKVFSGIGSNSKTGECVPYTEYKINIADKLCDGLDKVKLIIIKEE